MRHRNLLRFLSAGLSGWLLLSLACNYPGAVRWPQGLSGESLRATLAAQTVPAGGAASPVPGGTTGPVSPGPGAVTPVPSGGIPPPAILESDGSTFTYRVQSGDTLPALARRFGVEPSQVRAGQLLPPAGLLPAGLVLQIPDVLGNTLDPTGLLPDSEVIYSPSAAGFSPAEYIREAGGYLSTYEETVQGQRLSGAEILEQVAVELSVNPRLLLALLEYRSGWVTGFREDVDPAHPLGMYVPDNRGLSRELAIAATQLNIGYYGWRQGTLTEVKFQDGQRSRLAPGLNAGSAALQYLFTRLYKATPWQVALYGPQNFLTLYRELFGDPWARAGEVEPLFPPGLAQPVLELPFSVGERWSFTGGPHAAWNAGTPAGALDFSPVTGEPACAPSSAWVTAAAAGLVTRSKENVVVIDLDGDGFEGTDWTLFYLHIADQDRIPAGARVEVGEPIGHPSCERGRSTGTHVHIARRFAGEWLPAAGPLPFVLSGWQVQAGARSYEGELVKDGQVVSANPGGSRTAVITR